MARDPDDEREVFEAFEAWRDRHPGAALVVGIVRADPFEQDLPAYVTQFGLVGCDPLHLVAAAYDLLEAASERLRTHPNASRLTDLTCHVEAAMATLDFGPKENRQ